MKIGILNIQGSIEEHVEVVKRNGFEVVLVSEKKDLLNISGIIIPGGESTTIIKMLKAKEMYEPLKDFCKSNPVYATCAGLVILSNEHYGILDVDVCRNGFGSQINSFESVVKLKKKEKKINGVFIRAPYIKKINSKEIIVLAEIEDKIVGVETESILAVSFHPELTNDDTIFNEYIKKIKRI